MMKRKIYLLIMLCMGIVVLPAMAQQDLLLSQEIFSRVNKNPAATGNTNDIDIFLHGRIQWAGVDNGPKTTLLNITDYEEKIKSGFGLSLSYDCIGIGHRTINAIFSYAYQFDLSPRYVLSLGLGSGINMAGYDYTGNILEDESESKSDTYPMDKDMRLTPDFNFGFELSNPLWTLGASMNHLLNNESTTFKTGRHFYLYWTGTFPTGDKLSLAPTISYMNHNKTNVGELGLLVFYNCLIWGGVSYRPDLRNSFDPAMMAFILGFEFKKFRFGYSFDMGLGSYNLLPSSTHEVILSYGIGKKAR